MKHLVRPLVLLGGVLLLGFGCHSVEQPPASPPEVARDPDGCRSFAAVGGVSVGETPGEQRCRFDAASAEHVCEISAGGERISSVSEYASVADFVEAGHSLGKVTSIAETRTTRQGSQRTVHRYDELGRLVRGIEEARGRTTTTRYADYDAAGRPQRASVESSGDRDDCVFLVSIEYSDADRSVRRRSRAADPNRCGFGERTLVERYDAAGNRLSIDEADGGGVATLFEARHRSATERVCL